MARVFRRPLLLGLLVALVPVGVLLAGAGATEGDGSVAVVVSPDAYESAGDVPALRVIDYGSFVWLEVDAAGYEALVRSGVPFETRALGQLGLGSAVISTAPFEGFAPFAALETGVGFRLVQLIGPARDEWIDELEARGVAILQYIDPNAYLVRTALSADSLEQIESVRWAADYPVAAKLLPSLLGRAGTIQNVDVAIYDDGRVPDTVAHIEALGGGLVDVEPSAGQDAFVTATFVLPAEALQSVAAIETVAWLGYRQPVDPTEDEMSDQIIAGNVNPLNVGYNAWLTANGVNGNGIAVGVVDTGYDNGVDNANTHPDLAGRLNFVGTPNDTDGHGTHVGGIIAANASVGTVDASNFLMGLGVAPQATLIVRRNTGGDGARQSDIVTRGGVASNNSYRVHAPGVGYDARDRTLDMLVRDADQSTGALDALTIVFSAGNSGNAGPTKEAKNIIAVANSGNNRDANGNPGIGNINTIAGTSSRGPAQDGRTYPHVAAPGTRIISTQSPTGTASCLNAPTGAPGADPTYSLCSGTSMAAPHVTGSVALLTQWWQGFNAGGPSPAMAKALLINGAVDMGTADVPNNNEGWGRIDLSNVINTGIPTFYLDQSNVFGATGQTWSAEFIPANPALPVRATLVWTDAPALAAANPTLVNDLDLTVVESGTTYLGNDFANGTSTTGGTADRLNNAENVFLAAPTGASFVVSVSAAAIGGDGIPGNADATDQDFALVVQNAREVATVNIVKEVDAQPDGFFDDDPTGWSFDVDDDGNPSQVTGATGLLTFKVLPGTYDINEVDGPAGLWLTSASCIDDDGGAPVGTGITEVEYEAPQDAGVTGVALVAQQSITCTFQNESDQALIHVVKRVDEGPDGVFLDSPAGWTFDVFDDSEPAQVMDGTGMLTFPVRPGTYAVRETAAPAGDTGYWVVTASCTDDADGSPVGASVGGQALGPLLPGPVSVSGVDPIAGDSFTCVFENQRMAGFVTGGGFIKEGRMKTAKRVGFAGVVGVSVDGTFHGQWNVHFGDVNNPNVAGQHFKSRSVDLVVFGNDPTLEPPDPPTAVFNSAAWLLSGELGGLACTVQGTGTDHGEPARGKNKGKDADSVRVDLNCPGTSYDYSTSSDFPEEEMPLLHNLDGGNLQIHPPRE